MITSSQMRAARVMLDIDQSDLGEMAGLSVLAIQRMESTKGQVLGTTDALTNVVEALEEAGIELIGNGRPTKGIGRGIRLRDLDRQNGRASGAAIRPKKSADHAG